MGLATIVENIGEGLYRVKLQYDTTALERELAALNNDEATYSTLIFNALNTLSLLENDITLAADAVNELIKQWQDKLIQRGKEQPGQLEPDDPIDPETGNPWEDPDRAQEAPLLAAINAARAAAGVDTVSRDSQLDMACLSHLLYQKGTGQMGHIGLYGSNARDRANMEGYYNPVALDELLAYGPRTPTDASENMLKNNQDEFLDNAVTKAGVAHVYADLHIASYLWAVILASEKGPISTSTSQKDPAKDAAEKTEQSLDGINKPEQDLLKPEKLGEAVKKFGLAKQKYLAAQRELERLMAEKLIRIKRIEELEDLQNRINTTVIDAWACRFVTDLEIGSTVQTAEVPGYWQEDNATTRYSTFGKRNDPYDLITDYQVLYTERPLNLIPPNLCSSGKLQYSLVMTDSAIFVNAAIEPGHLKWKPLWRYGTITALSENICSILLAEISARPLSGNPTDDFQLDETLTLTNVPIVYPPCNGNVFSVGDEVLILFTGHDRNAPKVIGFRREPIPCPYGRTSWRQII